MCFWILPLVLNLIKNYFLAYPRCFFIGSLEYFQKSHEIYEGMSSLAKNKHTDKLNQNQPQFAVCSRSGSSHIVKRKEILLIQTVTV